MIARYPGKCRPCGGPFRPGDEIESHGNSWRHVGCASAAAPAAPAAVENIERPTTKTQDPDWLADYKAKWEGARARLQAYTSPDLSLHTDEELEALAVTDRATEGRQVSIAEKARAGAAQREIERRANRKETA